MDTPPEHQNCPCGKPLYLHTIPGIWLDDEVGHFFYINCPDDECTKSLKNYLSPWAMVIEWGLEGAEEMVEQLTKKEWNDHSDCPHIIFKREKI